MAFFNEKYHLKHSSSTADIMLGVVCHYCTEYGETRRDFLARRHSDSHTRNHSPVPSASLPRGPTTDIQDVRGQRHCRVVLFLVRQQQQLSPKETPRNVYSTSTITTSCLVPYMARHSGPSIDAALGTRNTERNIKDRERWKSGRSVFRHEHPARLHTSFHRLLASYQAYALRCESVLPEVISGSNPIASLQFAQAL